jgi:hypothetical protein
MLQNLTCVTAGCDQCGQDCFDDWDYLPHWPTEAAALADLANQGWQITGKRLVCRDCASVLACQTHGHQFGSWRDCGCKQRISDHSARPDGLCGAQWRNCQRCEHAEERPARVDDDQGVA